VKIQEIRKLKTEDLDKKLSELKLELSKELGSVKMGRAVKNPGKIKQLKKSIARIKPKTPKTKGPKAKVKSGKAKPKTNK
jgi:large subunit ribosomal protein L29